MKRSEINQCIREFEAKLKEHRFALPPFLDFTPEEWQDKGHEYDEIRDNALGWDITDYGEGRFYEKGLYLITLRNGNVHDGRYTKTHMVCADDVRSLSYSLLCGNTIHPSGFAV